MPQRVRGGEWIDRQRSQGSGGPGTPPGSVLVACVCSIRGAPASLPDVVLAIARTLQRGRSRRLAAPANVTDRSTGYSRHPGCRSRSACMPAFDVDAVRRRFSSLDDFAFFDAPGGTQVPGEVGEAI